VANIIIGYGLTVQGHLPEGVAPVRMTASALREQNIKYRCNHVDQGKRSLLGRPCYERLSSPVVNRLWATPNMKSRWKLDLEWGGIDYEAETEVGSIPIVILSAETRSGRLHLEPAEFAQTSWKKRLDKKDRQVVQRADRKLVSRHFNRDPSGLMYSSSRKSRCEIIAGLKEAH
jgi:hypothetical protein